MSQDKGEHLRLKARKLTRRKYAQQRPAGTPKGQVSQLVSQPPNLNQPDSAK